MPSGVAGVRGERRSTRRVLPIPASPRMSTAERRAAGGALGERLQERALAGAADERRRRVEGERGAVRRARDREDVAAGGSEGERRAGLVAGGGVDRHAVGRRRGLDGGGEARHVAERGGGVVAVAGRAAGDRQARAGAQAELALDDVPRAASVRRISQPQRTARSASSCCARGWPKKIATPSETQGRTCPPSRRATSPQIA